MEAELQGPAGRTTLGTGVVTLGRAPDNQLVINDSKASSHHAEIRFIGQGYTITDLGSTNGTFVNNQRLDRNVPRPLNAGDNIRIGDALLTYEVTGAMAGTPTDPGSSPQYQATILASPPEHTAYGAEAQQPYTPPQQSYTPAPPSYGSSPQQGYAPPQQYGSPPPYAPAPQYGVSPQQGYVPPPPAPGYQYAPPAQPYAPQASPGAIPSYPQQPYTPPPVQKKSGAGMRILIIAIVVIVILAGAGTALAFFLNRPQPVIIVTSSYKVGATPAGATGTVFHVSGQKFSGNSAITFLLDGKPVPGSPSAHSDADGKVQADLMVNNDWSVGSHTLTAKDASNYTTNTGIAMTVVPQGQAHTPGPNGAPPDDMSFTVHTSVQPQDAVSGKQQTPFTETLQITGNSNGGTVCRSVDNGQPQTLTGNSSNGITYRETVVWSCSGSYKGGKLTYTETASSDKIVFSNGVSCTAHTPYVAEHLDGTFTNNNTVNGPYSADGITADCTGGLGTQQFNASKGTWSGTV
jgi:FHA domain